MFQALTCPSSAGQIILSQHLVSSLSVNGCTVYRMRADCSPLSSGILYCTESDDTRCCDNIICPPEDGHVNARNMSKILMYMLHYNPRHFSSISVPIFRRSNYIITASGIVIRKLVIEISLYYDARSEKHQIM